MRKISRSTAGGWSLFPGRAKMAELIAQVDKSEQQVAQLQNLIVDNIIAVQEDCEGEYAGNKYRSYVEQANEISEKYRCRAKWGVLQTGNIIDVRAAFIMGQGVKITVEDEKAENEKKWLADFIDMNDLDFETPQEYAKEAEIEGKFLGKLFRDEKRKMISLRFMSWNTYKYDIYPNPQDYMDYQKVAWESRAGTGRDSLDASQFVYKRFGGRIDLPNESPPKVAKCLTQIEYLDKALRDWREINRIYAAPTPEIECDNAEDAKAMDLALQGVNWKIKKIFSHTGKFKYSQADASGATALEKEIVTLAKMISGTTGCPVHFLGLPDLMSNRSTAENLMELISASTLKERQIWIGAYYEIVRKAVAMWNSWSQRSQLDPKKFIVDIPYITAEQWLRLEKVYMPMAGLGKLSDRTLLSQIPGLNVEEELKRLEEQEKKSLERAKKFGLPTGDEDEDDEDEDEDGEESTQEKSL